MFSFLKSNLIWKLSGLSYRTAVLATNGSYVSKTSYILQGQDEMMPLMKYFNNNYEVLEFGCGPGKNLFALNEKIKHGVGLDINKFYIKLAKKLSIFYNVTNLTFMDYGGNEFPSLPKFDIIFEKGVFERLPKEKIENYIRSLLNYLNGNGKIILYFLAESAKHTDFVKRLGDNAYIYWSSDEIENMFKKLGLHIVEVQKWANAYVYIADKT